LDAANTRALNAEDDPSDAIGGPPAPGVRYIEDDHTGGPPRREKLVAGRPVPGSTDFDVLYRRTLDALSDLAQLAITSGRAIQGAALLEAEKSLALARGAADAHRAGRVNHGGLKSCPKTKHRCP
jgi:hypothetical protein